MSKAKAGREDRVNHPDHYKGVNGIEAIDVVEGFLLGFRTGNAVTYLLRAGRKHEAKDVGELIAATIQDLEKAQWYVAREIAAQFKALENWKWMQARLARPNRRAKKASRQ